MISRTSTGFLAALADGLGHGPLAREASARAVLNASENAQLQLDNLVSGVDRALHDTRGSTFGVVRFDARTKSLEFAGVGDLSAHLYHFKDVRYFPTSPSTLGHAEYRGEPRVERAPAEPGAVFVMFSDGLKTAATLKDQPEILRQPAIAVAQYLLETFGRNNDDVSVLVAKFGQTRLGFRVA